MNKLFWTWLPLGSAIIILSALVFIVVQQDYRQSANDPQIQLAEDAAWRLDHGSSPDTVIPDGLIDQTQSASPFMAVIKRGNLFAKRRIQPDDVAATNALRATDTKAILLPVTTAVIAAEQKGELHYTWETASGLRFATVVVPAKDYFVVTARSLKETEKRVATTAQLVLLGMISAMGVSFGLMALVRSKTV